MMRINRATSHAIRILVACAREPAPLVKVADLSERLDLTQQNSFKIVHLLSRAGFLKAVRGRNGGIALARPAGEIRIGDIVRAMEYAGPDRSGEAGESELDHDALMNDAFEAFLAVLNGTTIADMASTASGDARLVAGEQNKDRPVNARVLARAPLRKAQRRSAPSVAS